MALFSEIDASKISCKPPQSIERNGKVSYFKDRLSFALSGNDGLKFFPISDPFDPTNPGDKRSMNLSISHEDPLFQKIEEIDSRIIDIMVENVPVWFSGKNQPWDQDPKLTDLDKQNLLRNHCEKLYVRIATRAAVGSQYESTIKFKVVVTKKFCPIKCTPLKKWLRIYKQDAKDEIYEVGVTPISITAPANSSTISVESTLGFIPGDTFRVRKANSDVYSKEEFTIKDVSRTALTLVKPTPFTYESGDSVVRMRLEEIPKGSKCVAMADIGGLFMLPKQASVPVTITDLVICGVVEKKADNPFSSFTLKKAPSHASRDTHEDTIHDTVDEFIEPEYEVYNESRKRRADNQGSSSPKRTGQGYEKLNASATLDGNIDDVVDPMDV